MEPLLARPWLTERAGGSGNPAAVVGADDGEPAPGIRRRSPGADLRPEPRRTTEKPAAPRLLFLSLLLLIHAPPLLHTLTWLQGPSSLLVRPAFLH